MSAKKTKVNDNKQGKVSRINRCFDRIRNNNKRHKNKINDNKILEIEEAQEIIERIKKMN